ncbi:50S ribosomal protein L23 [Astathelohania contejeani]|uniref:50S ribosomal protein L23 n=1 Tax=Astathelohania contejeani TaxID=164912 RepID=A0ABQ7HXB7_9MICR|nr:50S ribosomal protein L23 [Thelohania contejeani]
MGIKNRKNKDQPLISKKIGKTYAKVVVKPSSLSPADIIRYGCNNEKAAILMERDNTLTFIVDKRANKPMIKDAVRALYGVKIQKIRTLNTYKGEKKAYVKLVGEGEALRVANLAQII